MLALLQGHLFLNKTRARIAPVIDEQGTIHIHANAVVCLGPEDILATIKEEGPSPPRGEIVAGKAISGRACTPVKADRHIIAHKGGIATELCVVKVFALPPAKGVDPLPPQTDEGVPRLLQELDANGVRAIVQVGVPHIGPRGIAVPLVNDQAPIDPDTHAIIDVGQEAIAAFLEHDVARPASAEPVLGHSGIRRAGAPIEIESQVVTHEHGIADQIWVAEILALPIRVEPTIVPPDANLRVVGTIIVGDLDQMLALGEVDVA